MAIVHDDVNFLNQVRAEANRARNLFPNQSMEMVALALAEESGEAVKATLDVYFGNGKATPADLVKECIQTAAMAMRLALDVEHLSRQERADE
jgi:hypothetical protein